MSTITIRYQSPANDPYKIPRPHRVELDDRTLEAGEVYGGEIGPVGNLLGFCPTVTPDVDDWKLILADALYRGEVTPELLVGWYPQFSGDGQIFGYDAAIKSIEISA
ncbi:hypothetical protein QEH40_gp43 [Microbacterium phage OscarSo]|uniref:Uncharacterized protein n=1 Tax=Microbacterium phage OscarSo TaxID=2985324 RepID=A0A9X9K535_9CAUD|nr:hypothetical protein QEH40_gp43 [Microbacterium phage OscarSo]UYL87164.1 hypothetical protein SEA_OSCARSO_43 [Microbacterium phage OscarSo]